MRAIPHTWINAFNRLSIWKRQVRFEDYKIQVPNFDRWLYVKLHALGLMGSEEREFLRRHARAGMTVLDIGANIGLYSMLLAELVGGDGKVFAFEPDPVLFEAAVVNAQQNEKSEVLELQNLALGSRSGQATLYRSSFNSGDNRLSASATHKDAVSVEIARLDDVLGDTPIDLVKMDVQGWEAEVLRGMEQILKNNSEMTIYFEYWPEGLRRAGEQVSAPLEILRQCGFSIWFPEGAKPLTTPEMENLEKKYSGNRFVNLMARRA